MAWEHTHTSLIIRTGGDCAAAQAQLITSALSNLPIFKSFESQPPSPMDSTYFIDQSERVEIGDKYAVRD
jgi:hypothetical protein